MIIFKALLILFANVCLSYLFVKIIYLFLFFPKNAKYVFGKKVFLAPGYVFRKKDFLEKKVAYFMNIALIGYGKVGKFIEELSVNYSNITISKRFDPIIFNNKLNKEELENIDVCIDFSTPNSVLQNAKIVASAKKNLIIGTTGWEENFELIKNLTLENEIGIVYGSNFSVGMNLFFKLLQYFSSLMNKVASYDVYGYESHHNQKLDSPSGTAKTLTNIILENIDRKKIPQFEKLENKIKPEELHFASIRAGSIFGNHTIGFDSEFDEITLTHSAKNRKGFALGALNAAIFIHQKKGFFKFEEIFDQILNQQ